MDELSLATRKGAEAGVVVHLLLLLLLLLLLPLLPC
jgi:hypothetical protein